MCEIKEGFKLCTCGELKQEKADWVLYRKRAKDGTIIIGSVLPIYLDKEDSIVQAMVLKNLNEKNVFDFEYQPQKEDILEIKNKKNRNNSFLFEFINEKWTTREMSSLLHKSLMEGKLK